MVNEDRVVIQTLAFAAGEIRKGICPLAGGKLDEALIPLVNKPDKMKASFLAGWGCDVALYADFIRVAA